MDNMRKAVVKKGKDTTVIEIGSKRWKIFQTAIIISAIAYSVSSLIRLILYWME